MITRTCSTVFSGRESLHRTEQRWFQSEGKTSVSTNPQDLQNSSFHRTPGTEKAAFYNQSYLLSFSTGAGN
jgi:hypothetical protein